MAETVGRLDENLSDEELELLKEVATVKAIQRKLEQSEEPYENIVGGNIKRYRKSLNLTLDQLGSKCGRGKGVLSRIENGNVWPALGTLKDIAEALGCKVEDLFLLRVSERLAEEEDLYREQVSKRLAEAERALQEIANFFGLSYDGLLQRFK